MNKHVIKNILICISILILGILSFINYQEKSVRALSGFSCNYYTGQCFVDSQHAKYTNESSCTSDCKNNKFKYYCNTRASAQLGTDATVYGQCVLDFRGTYSDQKSCMDACKTKQVYITEGNPLGVSYTEFFDSYRPYKKTYYCAKEQRKCIFKYQIYNGDNTYNGEKINLNNQYNYYDCWTVCMQKDINKLPAQTVYTCNDYFGECMANPGGEYVGINSCDASCKKRDYSKIKYSCDPVKGCVESTTGCATWSECMRTCKKT